MVLFWLSGSGSLLRSSWLSSSDSLLSGSWLGVSGSPKLVWFPVHG